jgi:hypothetical protein
VILIGVAGINVSVDPYGMFRLIDRPGFNAVKPMAGPHGAMVKAYQVARIEPRGLILGNSRAEVGFDPESPAWPAEARPVFNLALPGTGTSTTLHYLQHALAIAEKRGVPKPTLVVWGVDFVDFMASSDKSAEIDLEDRRLLSAATSDYSAKHMLQETKDYVESAFTLAAFVDSIATMWNQRNPYAADLTRLGFNPMRNYVGITRDVGYRPLFRQKDGDYLKAFEASSKQLFLHGQPSRPFNDFIQIVRLCRANEIKLKLVVYPYHAHFLEMIRMTGHWPAFEEWLRTLVKILADEAPGAGGNWVQFWAFNDLYELTGESVPDKGDTKEVMKWYWESGHFKSALGNLVLDRLFGRPGVPEGFGVKLDSDNVEAYIADLRHKSAEYRAANAGDVAELERMLSNHARR